MLVIGLNAYHGDASACLFKDGQLHAAAEEERFRRIKHWAGFPSLALAYCLKSAGARLSDVAHIAINSDPRASLGARIGYTLRKRPDPRLVLERLRNQRKRSSVASELEAAFPGDSFKGTLHRVEHHLAHLASCFHVSPFEDAVAVSVDGFGDFSSAAWGVGAGNNLSVDGRVQFPHSLGIFYQALTQYLGFPNYGDEYKVMGLAPYGRPVHIDAMSKIVRLLPSGAFELDTRYFRHHVEQVAYTWEGGSPSVGTLYSDALADLLGPARKASDPLTDRHRDIARSIQAMYETAFFHLLHKLHDRYRLDRLTLAGGCAMNSVANGKVRRKTPFKEVYVQSAAGDAGGAIGAAAHIVHSLPDAAATRTRTPMMHASWGPSFTDAEIATLLQAKATDLTNDGCTTRHIDDEADLCRIAADAVAQGRVVGWFQGRMEWGPRALGNRSIIGDPRRADMKDILNLKIKRRESFRPFAPSVMREAVSAWFEEDDDVPFMMQVYQIRDEKRALIPAVTHVDGSGRLQTVHRDANPRYHRLISAFNAATGVPMVLNTSFNENEPVVCTPQEALDCFLRTKMDVLVMQNWIVSREAAT